MLDDNVIQKRTNTIRMIEWLEDNPKLWRVPSTFFLPMGYTHNKRPKKKKKKKKKKQNIEPISEVTI